MIYVIKKDGTREEFNSQKIVAAVNKSAARILYTFSDKEKEFICQFAEEHAEALGKILGIKREEIMACGDAPNDWNMLEMAGLPVVMANADEETKKKAAFITKSNEEDGVAYAVEQFVLKNG